MRHFFLSAMLSVSVASVVAQTTTTPASLTAPTRSPLRPIAHTRYTSHTELFAEFRPLLLNVPARFTAHLTEMGDRFKPYTNAEVTLKLMIGGKIAWQQTLKQPTAPGIYRFPVQSGVAGTGIVTISLKTPTYSEQFTLENVTVYGDEAAALASQGNLVANPATDEVAYYKEKSWLEDFATAPVVKTKGAIRVPKTALLTEGSTTYVYVQTDPEHFRKQVVQAGKSTGNTVDITGGLTVGTRIVTLGAEKIK